MAHPDLDSHSSFDHLAHRPWPLPAGRWAGRQSWRDLLFAHWPVPTAAVRRLMPEGLAVDEFEGSSWIGVVPFRMAGVMLRGLPDLPGISAFPELNVRVYVAAGGKPGVWFLSLDATNPLAVWGARTFLHLPYYRASIDITPKGEGFDYLCVRRGSAGMQRSRGAGEQTGGGQEENGFPSSIVGRWESPNPSPVSGLSARFAAHYRPVSAVYAAAPGTLEHWLTERYCLYAQSTDKTLWRTEVHHQPWPLQRAEAELADNTISAAGGLPVSGPPALLHFARRIDVVVWRPERVTRS
jgi:uncharacterized protein YqjF (DUF2071 family)